MQMDFWKNICNKLKIRYIKGTEFPREEVYTHIHIKTPTRCTYATTENMYSIFKLVFFPQEKKKESTVEKLGKKNADIWCHVMLTQWLYFLPENV